MSQSKKVLSRRYFLKLSAASAAAAAAGVPAINGARAASDSASTMATARQSDVTIQFGLWGFWEIPDGDGGSPGQQAMRAFLDQNPHIRLEQIDVNIWDAAVLRTSIAGGTAPAYFMSGVVSNWNTAGTLSSQKQGLFADITDLYTRYDIDSQLSELALMANRGKYATPDGVFYGVPLEIGIGNGIAYRKDLVEDAGFSPTTEWTWEDVRDIAKELNGEFVKGIAMQSWGLDFFMSSEGVGNNYLLSEVPAPNTSWNWQRDYETWIDSIEYLVELFRTMLYDDESILTDIAIDDAAAGDALYNRTAKMATIPGVFMTRTGIPNPIAIAEEEGVPFDEIIGYLPHPRGLNGHNYNFATNQPISFSPTLSSGQLEALVQMYMFLELGEGFDLKRRIAYEESGRLPDAYAAWPFVRANQTVEGVDGTARDAWGGLVDTVEYLTSIGIRPEAGEFIPAEGNQGPTNDAWNDLQSQLTFDSGGVNIREMVKDAQNVFNRQASDFDSSVGTDEFVESAREYYAALAAYWQDQFPVFYEGTFKDWYETIVADALDM